MSSMNMTLVVTIIDFREVANQITLMQSEAFTELVQANVTNRTMLAGDSPPSNYRRLIRDGIAHSHMTQSILRTDVDIDIMQDNMFHLQNIGAQNADRYTPWEFIKRIYKEAINGYLLHSRIGATR